MHRSGARGLSTPAKLQRKLNDYLEKFVYLAREYDGTLRPSSELEAVIDDYSAFILDDRNRKAWGQLEEQQFDAISRLAAELRKTSALCVAMMEKYRAWKLLNGSADHTDYFSNIETCIEAEFGSFQASSESKVLLVGSGSYPMTPLLIARRTGAEVTGIDIDEEAVELGRRVTARLGEGLRIRLEHAPIEQLDALEDVTHIIFSSTVADKYELLELLHPLTGAQVVVVMRYGDQLKSVFNYPMQQVDERKWKLVDTIVRSDHVFDIALYQKA